MLSVSIFFTGENQDGLNCRFTRPLDNVSLTITTPVNKPPRRPASQGLGLLHHHGPYSFTPPASPLSVGVVHYAPQLVSPLARAKEKNRAHQQRMVLRIPAPVT
ncbi:hypothetical protein E2C01_068789 [Portunus trituberculatus]|uniref:Uncharacterized protein n=1 Tax=Portunus trituberculatus TaxID=210409 RepID=A0A5B7HNB5_PORTR|nr:hypothetical protein [Portunus trituberculatus]